MKKILVIGSGGAGKSTFAEQLGQILGIKVLHLDALYWQPGWVEPTKAEWAATVSALLSGDEWIMDGNYSGTLAQRLAACDTVMFLDLPPLTCAWRILKRLNRYRNTTRPAMAAGCPEQFSLPFLFWVLSYRGRTRPKILKLLKQYENTVTVIQLQTPTQVSQFLRTKETLN